MKMVGESYSELMLQIGRENASQVSSSGAQIGLHIFKKNGGNQTQAPGDLLVLPGALLLAHVGQFLSLPGTPWDFPLFAGLSR